MVSIPTILLLLTSYVNWSTRSGRIKLTLLGREKLSWNSKQSVDCKPFVKNRSEEGLREDAFFRLTYLLHYFEMWFRHFLAMWCGRKWCWTQVCKNTNRKHWLQNQNEFFLSTEPYCIESRYVILTYEFMVLISHWNIIIDITLTFLSNYILDANIKIRTQNI